MHCVRNSPPSAANILVVSGTLEIAQRNLDDTIVAPPFTHRHGQGRAARRDGIAGIRRRGFTRPASAPSWT